MMFRVLDSAGDWTFGKGKANFYTGAAAVGANIKTRLYCFLGDCFFDVEAGIDWFKWLGTKEINALEFQVRAVILDTPGVDKLTSFYLRLDANRDLRLTYTVTTVFGIAITESLFEIPPPVSGDIHKFVYDFAWPAADYVDVVTSSRISDARLAVWVLYDVDDGYSVVLGAVQPLDAIRVRITVVPRPSGNFRLVGIA